LAKSLLLGLFHDVAATADAIEQLRRLGVSDEQLTVMSGVPYRADMLGRPHPKGQVGWAALGGALLGLLTALTVTLSSYLLYPLEQGGQPIVPIPPTLIVVFEFTMLGTMWASFFGLLFVNRFPNTATQLYDSRITQGQIGLLAEVDDALADQVANALQTSGAHDLKRAAATLQSNFGFRVFWTGLLGAAALGGAMALLFAFNILRLPLPTDMAEQDSIAPQMGPRLGSPPGAVPVQGPVLIEGEPATLPISPTVNSLQRGKVLFETHCALCHGQSGVGDGPLVKYFTPKPADLTSDKVQTLSESELFLIITEGAKAMPSLIENLDPGERWDVINYVRTLKKR
jgi:hypothetical protein